LRGLGEVLALLFTVFITKRFVNSTKTSSKSGIKLIFDRIISSAKVIFEGRKECYLPGSNLAISAHLLPCFL